MAIMAQAKSIGPQEPDQGQDEEAISSMIDCCVVCHGRISVDPSES